MASQESTSPREVGIMDKKWEEVQCKTFTKWINSKIKHLGHSITTIKSDELSDGNILGHLLSAISGGETISLRKNAKMHIQKVENVGRCLAFIKSKNIQLPNIGAEDIAEANPKLTLGLIWIIILRFTITDINNEGQTARDGLLLWCNRRLEPYGVKVDNFTSSWKDGKAIAALVHSEDPSAIDHEKTKTMSDLDRVKEAFQCAERAYMIPQLLDAEDVCTPVGPDEKSNMTYLAQFFHAFSDKSNKERASRRVNNFCNGYKVMYDMNHDYENRCNKLLTEYKTISSDWASFQYDGTFKDLVSKFKDMSKYKRGKKRELVAERSDLVTLFSTIQTKCDMYGFKRYTPPAGLSVEDTSAAATAFLKAEENTMSALRTKKREFRERVHLSYRDGSTSFMQKIAGILNNLSKITGDLDSQEVEAKKLTEEHQSMAKQLKDLEKIWEDCIETGVDGSDDIEVWYEDLAWEHDDLGKKLQTKLAFVQNQKSLQGVSNLTETQMKLYETTFKLFDKDCSNTLSKVEFQAALAALGFNIPEEETVVRLKRTPENADLEISLFEFTSFLRSLEEDQASSSQVMEAFSVLGGGKPEIAVETLIASGLTPELAQLLVKEMTPADNGLYNPSSLVQNTYAN